MALIRRHENPLAVKAGLLALLVHALFFMLLVMSFNWRSVEPLQLDDVELWDSLPAPVVVAPPPPPAPPEPRPEPKIEPEPKPAPPPQPKADIEVKPKKPEPKPEPKKPEPKKQEKPKPVPPKKDPDEELRKLQQELLSDDPAQSDLERETKQLAAERKAAEAQKLAAASKGVIDEARARIMRKIYSRMNRQPCGNAIPIYEFSLLPTGEVSGKPRLLTSSGIAACDDAASRAILQAQPLPLPDNPELFSNFRDLKVTFKPE